jgi:hypothetical protein
LYFERCAERLESLPKADDLFVAMCAGCFKRHTQTLLAAGAKICAILFVKVREYVDED